MTTYEVTIGKIHIGIMGTEFIATKQPKQIRAKSFDGAVQAALGTRASLTRDHDVPQVLAVDRDFRRSVLDIRTHHIRAAHVVWVK